MSGPASTLGRLRHEHSRMLGGSIWLLAGTVCVSLGSIVFWLLVANNATTEDVGRATALFSASLFVCYLVSAGLPIAISRYSTDRTQGSATLFAWSLLLTVVGSLVGVAVFEVVAPESIREGLSSWSSGPAWLVVFLLVVGLAISGLVDVRLMALRRWSLVFWRALLIGVVRLPFLLWIPESGAALYIYAVAAGGFAVTGIFFLPAVAQRGWLRLRPLPERARRAARFTSVNYLGQLAVQAPFFAVPFAVLVTVDAVENARFYLSWGVMSIVYIGLQMVSQALLVEGGRGGADHRRQAMVAMVVGLGISTFAMLASLGFGPVLARLYGPDYGPVATLLPILMAGTIPFAVTMTTLTTARIQEHTYATIAVAVGFALSVMVPTVLLVSSDGALGAAWGWTAGNALAAGLALLAARIPTRSSSEQVQSAAAATTPIPPIAEAADTPGG